MLNCIVVGIGGFIGSVGRYLIGIIPIKNPLGFPVNTLIVNVVGAFLIGCIVGAATKNVRIDPRLILFLKTGICGGFTTFSTFALEATDLVKTGEMMTAMIYMVLTAILGILAVLAGQFLCR